MSFRTRFNYGKSEGFSCKAPSLTQQQFKDDADINVIVARYSGDGVYPEYYDKGPGMYGDFTKVPTDLQGAYEVAFAAQRNFDSLPLDVRKRFNYDPQAFLAFATNPANLDELVAMGLATKTEKNDNTEDVNKDTSEVVKDLGGTPNKTV